MIYRNILWVGIGGGAGSIARYLCQRAMSSWFLNPFPIGTFVVNVSGCFLIGLLHAIAVKTNILNPGSRLLLTTGFCGGYTTFSTFANENAELIRTGNFLTPALYISLSVLLGVAAVFAGDALLR
jgi:fluoride exporter